MSTSGKIAFLPLPGAAPPGPEIRVLTAEEIATVEPVFAATGNPLPDPAVSCFVGAVEGGKVLGFIVLQLRLHAEPMWLEEGHSDLFKPLVRAAERTILQRVGPAYAYVFAPAGRISQMAQSMGMQMEPWVVFSKLVMPEAPVPATLDLGSLAEPPAESSDSEGRKPS
jgi:hypothetical protein